MPKNLACAVGRRFAYRYALLLQLFAQGGTTTVMRAYAISCPICSLHER